MKAKRLWWTVHLMFTPSSIKRADYARKHKIYGAMGENVSIQSRVIPIYSELIKLHNNIAVARNVDFCTHDMIHMVLNRSRGAGDSKTHWLYRNYGQCVCWL